jgi:site-specific DNA recombinase
LHSLGNRQQAASSGTRDAQSSELLKVRRQIERLVDALMNGTPAAAVNDRLNSLERQRTRLEQELAQAVAPAPRIHPNLAEVYRQKVAGLIDLLDDHDQADIRAQVRGLIAEIVLTPEEGKLRIGIRGELATILTLSQAATRKSADRGADALSEQVKLVAGIGFEPMTFRL